MKDKVWDLCKQLARELSNTQTIIQEGWSEDSINTHVIMQAQDFYNLFNILDDRGRYDARKICKLLEEELEK